MPLLTGLLEKVLNNLHDIGDAQSLKGNPDSWKFGEKHIDELRILQKADC